MPTNITGNPAAGESPSPDPDAGTAPISTVPVSGDAVTAASVRQALGNPLDHLAYAKSPFAKPSAWVQPVQPWRNAALQMRAIVSHPGFVEGKVLAWQEDWQDVGFIAGKSAVGNGIFAGRWHYSISGDPVGGGIISNFPPMADPGGGGTDADLRTSSMFLVSNAGGSVRNVEEVETSGQIFVDDDTCIAIQWDAKCGGAGVANSEDAGGLIASTLLGSTNPILTANPFGLAFLRINAGTTWEIYYNVSGGSPTTGSTGIAVSGRQRFRIEYYGANVSDDGVARAIFYIDGAIVPGGNVPVSLTAGGGSLRAFFRHFDLATLSWMNVQTVDFRANTWPGNVAF